ncbi:MAG: MFS transporter [Treponema sp.]|jgi:OFA family oxalate/formate antiporter-like MFS transporter|nr:MFS transporter [Treponema sp.]
MNNKRLLYKQWFHGFLGVVTLLLLGLIYVWSVFVGPLEKEFGWTRSETSLTFSISLVAFCLGGLMGGFLSKLLPSRLIMSLSALLILTGFTTSSFVNSLPGLYICYGVVCGFGVGLGYNSTLNSILKWFPGKQGVLSGILLMGFGFGGSILGSAAVYMMSRMGWRLTFRILGTVIFVLVGISSLLIQQPPAGYAEEIGKTGPGKKRPEPAADMQSSRMIRERSFRAYFLWGALLSAAGLAIIGNAVSMAGTFTENVIQAAFVGGLVNTCNGIGRFGFGFLFDITGSKGSLLIITGGLICSMLILTAAFISGSLIILGIGFVVTGLSYGGITPCNSAYIAKVFGQKYYSMNFSLINLVLLIAAFLGPYSAGLMQAHGGFIPMILLMGCFCIIGVPVLFLINRHTKPIKS